MHGGRAGSRMSRVRFEEVVGYWRREDEGEGAKAQYRLPWIWVEGWRGKLRTAGDVVKRKRYERRRT